MKRQKTKSQDEGLILTFTSIRNFLKLRNKKVKGRKKQNETTFDERKQEGLILTFMIY